MSRRRREVQFLERMVLLVLIIILVAMIARRFSDVARVGEGMAARAELDQVQKAMWAYMLASETERVKPALCVSDFGASTPALWPNYLDRRYSGRGRSYSWDQEGAVSPCATATPRSKTSPESNR